MTSPSRRRRVGSEAGVRQPETSKSPRGQRRDHTVGGLVAIPTDLVLETRPEVRSQQREPVGIADPVRIGLVAPPLVERVQPADVVEVVMGGDGHDRPVVSECLELRAEIADPVARIDDEIALPAAHVPHVRLEERVDVILHEQHDLIGNALDTEPSFGNGQIDHVRSVKKTDEGSGRRQ
jgi:hypothetical protein